jgi:HSP20 family protein
VVANLIETAAQEGERVFKNGPPGGPAGNPGGSGSTRVTVPPVDVIETPDEVLVLFDLPGVDPQAIDVTLVGNMLSIHGSCPVHLVQPGQTVHRTERPAGRFERSLPLPCAVDGEQVSAHSNQGVLTIRLARQRPEPPRPIQVKVQPVGGQPG